ncbi:MAG: serine hydrolase [Deltaproteobacteria bacterium]|nr:serine hydrolase [Deltaproteobacteria bacterium]
MKTSRRVMTWFAVTAVIGGCVAEEADVSIDESAEIVIPQAVLETAARNAYLKSRLAAMMSSGELGTPVPALGAALVVDGKIVASAVHGVRTWGQPEVAGSNDYFNMGSVGKVATGYLVAQMIAWNTPLPNGQTLTWSTKVFDVFPELAAYSHPAYVNTTVEQLLSHTSGMPGGPSREPDDQYASRYADIRLRRYAYVKDAIADTPVVVPGKYFYGGGSIIVAAMLERLVGFSWEKMMEMWVEPQLGMTNTGPGQAPYPPSNAFTTRHEKSANGTPIPWSPPPGSDLQANSPAGNLHGSINDMAKLASAFLVNSAHRPGNVPLATIQDAITMVPNGYTKAGWATGGAPWGGTSPILWKNGSDGKSKALICVSNVENFATVAAMSVDIGDAAPGTVHIAIAALQRHLATAGSYLRSKTIGAIATATGTGVATRAVDGDLNTEWKPGATSATLTLTLAGAIPLSELRIAEKGNHIQSFTLQGRFDTLFGTLWITIASGNAVGANYAASFSSVTTNQLRLIVNGNANMAIDEVWVF